MADIEHAILINAPVGTVFDFVVAEWQGSLAFWHHGIGNWRPVAAEPLGTGFRVRYTARVLGVPFPMEMQVVEFVPGHRWAARAVRGPRAEGRWEFVAQGAGTVFTYRLSYELPPPLLGRVLDRAFFAPAWRRAINDALAELKRLIESRNGRSQAAAQSR